MIIIDVKEALKPKPKPKVEIMSRQSPTMAIALAKEIPAVATPEEKAIPDEKALLLADILTEEREIHKRRNRLSNYYHELEAKTAPIEEFSANYDCIEALTGELKGLYDKRQYIEKHGSLPEPEKKHNPAESQNIFELKELRRSLNNRKCKESKKLADTIKYPEGSARRQEILQKVDQLEAEQGHVITRIKALNQYEG